MTSIADAILNKLIDLPDKFYIVDENTWQLINTALPKMRPSFAKFKPYLSTAFVSMARKRRGRPPKVPVRASVSTPNIDDKNKPDQEMLEAQDQGPADVNILEGVAAQLAHTPPPTVSDNSRTVTIRTLDLIYILDQLIRKRNENYLLEQRVETLELVLKWAFQFLTFVQSFSTLIFHNGLPISAVIFNTDMFNVPFDLLDYVARKMRNLENDLNHMYQSLVWTVAGNVVSRVEKPQKLEFAESSSNAFEASVIRMRSDYLAFVAAYNKPNDFITHGLKDIVPDETTRLRLIDELRALCDKYGLADFSPQYLLQQSHLASLLMHFATSVYTFVPQLQVDFGSEENLEFSLGKYLGTLRSFWQTQTNLSVGPFHVKFSLANMNKLREVDIERLLARVLRPREDFAQLSVETQQILSQLTFKSINRHVNVSAERRLVNAWRQVLNTLSDKMTDDVELFKIFMQYALSDREGLFNKSMLVRFDRVLASDYLANLVYSSYEQNTILKLIISQLITRVFLPDMASASMHDPLILLADRLPKF